jgi:integrase
MTHEATTPAHRTQISRRDTARYGPVVDARVIIDPATRRSVVRTFKVGTPAERTVAAERWIATTLADLANGTAAETATARRQRARATRAATPATADWTLGGWASHTLTTNTRRSSSTREQYLAAINRHFAPLLPLPLTTITPELIESRAADLVADGAGPVSVRRSMAALSGVLTDAVRRRLIPWNAARTAAVPDQSGARRRPARALSAADLKAFLHHVDDATTTTAATRAAVRLLVATGLRRSELCALHWADVTISADTATLAVRAATTVTASGHLRTAEPKTARSVRTILVKGRAVAALKAWRSQQRADHLAIGIPTSPTTHVFTRDGGQLRPDHLSDLVAKASKAAGVPRITSHSLRHTSGTRLIDAGADLTAVSRRLGHASVRTTESVYVHELAARETQLADLAALAIG